MNTNTKNSLPSREDERLIDFEILKDLIGRPMWWKDLDRHLICYFLFRLNIYELYPIFEQDRLVHECSIALGMVGLPTDTWLSYPESKPLILRYLNDRRR